jgi:hypothetical protein
MIIRGYGRVWGAAGWFRMKLSAGSLRAYEAVGTAYRALFSAPKIPYLFFPNFVVKYSCKGEYRPNHIIRTFVNLIMGKRGVNTAITIL